MDKQLKIEKRREYDRNWKREQRKKFPDKVRAYGRLKYQKINQDSEKLKKRREYMKKYQAKWQKLNPRLEYRREWMRNWNRKNSKSIYAKRRKRPYEKLAATIRSRIKDVLRNGYYTPRTEKLLGCTFKELKNHLESQFKEGMSWENYGFYGWHADHIIPLSSFNLNNEEEQKKAFHFTNLQPLWAQENLKKHARVI